jgi:hypothetical protein
VSVATRFNPRAAAGCDSGAPTGHVVTDVPPPTRARGPGICEQNRAQGIAIDEWTAKGLEAYDACDYGMAVDGLIWRHERRRAEE